MNESVRGNYKDEHGKWQKTSLYRVWCEMRARCNSIKNKRYVYYGGRGITVCPEWNDSYVRFHRFIAEVLGPRPSNKHSLDRIDNNKGYYPDNVRWASVIEQARNKRNNKYLTINGVSKCFAELEQEYGLTQGSISMKVSKGYSVESLLVKPYEGTRKNTRFVTIGNETKTLKEWAKLMGCKEGALRMRLAKGWSDERLINAVKTAQESNHPAEFGEETIESDSY